MALMAWYMDYISVFVLSLSRPCQADLCASMFPYAPYAQVLTLPCFYRFF